MSTMSTMEEKKPSREARVMVSATKRHSDSESQQIYISNTSNSPLLKLPAELRNRIWLYVLAGNNIHIHLAGNSTRSKLCQLDQTDRQTAFRLKKTSRNAKRRTYFTRHKKCFAFATGHLRSSLSLQLLQTCRQIHKDASLLPFLDNTFSFTYPYSLSGFLKTLSIEQAGAISHLCITPSGVWPMETLFEQHVTSRLSSVQKLTWFHELDAGGQDSAFVLRQNVRQEDADWLMCFGHCPLSSVVVVVYRVNSESWCRMHGTLRYSLPAFTTSMANEWEKYAEERLLATVTEVDESSNGNGWGIAGEAEQGYAELQTDC